MSLQAFIVGGEVKVSDGRSVPVRGLGLSDIADLVKEHRVHLEAAFETFRSEDAGAMDDVANRLLSEAPNLAHQIIALAADDSIESAGRIPFGLQVEILEECGRQTFITEGGAGKTMEIVINMFSGITGKLAAMRDPQT